MRAHTIPHAYTRSSKTRRTQWLERERVSRQQKTYIYISSTLAISPLLLSTCTLFGAGTPSGAQKEHTDGNEEVIDEGRVGGGRGRRAKEGRTTVIHHLMMGTVVTMARGKGMIKRRRESGEGERHLGREGEEHDGKMTAGVHVCVLSADHHENTFFFSDTHTRTDSMRMYVCVQHHTLPQATRRVSHLFRCYIPRRSSSTAALHHTHTHTHICTTTY